MPEVAPVYDLQEKRVWVAGHRGMVGSAIVRRLDRERCEIVTVTRDEVDLRRADQVEDWMAAARPHAIFLAAARVGGIFANDTRPAEFLYDNLMIEANVVEAARRFRVEKLLLLGSSCIYPKFAEQPIGEHALLTGMLEPTNQWYAVAKIAGIKLCQSYHRQYGCDFISAMPSNLYGPGDNFDLISSHVIPGLIAKAHAAKLTNEPFFEVWGSGRPRREFLYVEDAADAAVYLMRHYSGESQVNVGTGSDVTVADIAGKICAVVGYQGHLRFDPSKPDGTPRKLLDVSMMTGLGWQARVPLQDGLERTFRWFLEHKANRPIERLSA